MGLGWGGGGGGGGGVGQNRELNYLFLSNHSGYKFKS